MIGVGEILLLLVAFLFAGGVASKLAKWIFFRRATGSKQLLWAVTSWLQGRGERPPPVGSEREGPAPRAEDPDTGRG